MKKPTSDSWIRYLVSTLLFFFFFTLDSYSAPGEGLAFDGIDDYVESPANANLDFGTGNFTVEYWVKKRTTSNSGYDNMAGVCKWNAGGSSPGQNEWSLAMGSTFNDNFPAFNIESGTTTYGAFSSVAMIVNTWHHIAGVRNGTTLSVYLDGVLRGSTTLPANLPINNVGRKLRIAVIEANIYQTDAIFDEVRIWNVARSASEILSNMNAELITMPCELIVYYKFNNGIANSTNTGLNSLIDIAGGDNNANLFNFSLSGAASNWTDGSGITPNTTVLSTSIAWFLDSDGDGVYTGSAVFACLSPGTGYYNNLVFGGDCDDANSAIFPGAIEICGNGIDEDCNGNDGTLSIGNSGNGCITGSSLSFTGNGIAPKVITWKNNSSTILIDQVGYNTNGSTSTATELNRPAAACFDKTGNMYVADFYNNRVRKYPPGSTSATVGTTVAQIGINGAGGVFVDRFGTIYVSSFFNHTVFKFPSNSSVSTVGTIVAGGNGLGNSATQLNNPLGVYVDANGNLYVTEYANSRVQKYPPNSTSATPGVIFAGGNGNGSGATQLNGPINLFEDVAHNFYVSDYNNNRIQKFPASSTAATSGTTVAANGMSGPEWVHVEKGGTMYVASYNTHKILRYPAGSNSSTPGVIVAGTGTSGSSATQLNGPNGLAFDAIGNMYVADYFNSRIQKFTLNAASNTYLPSSEGSYSVEVEYANGTICTSNNSTIAPVPTIICPGNQSANADANCNAVVNYTSIITGIPAPSITYTFSGATIGSGSGDGSGSIFQLGTTLVTLSASNSCGTVSCTFTVVVSDITPPILTCPSTQVVNADTNCQAILGDYTTVSSVNLTVTVNSTSSGTSCTDGFFEGAPEPQRDIKIAGQGYTTYPQNGICFTNAPFLQYNQNFTLGNYPTTLAVCLNAYEDDGAACVVAKSCSVEVCQNFITPAPGSSVTYTLNIPNDGINTSWGTVTFTLQASAPIPALIATDNCAGVSVTQSPPAGSVLNLGSNTVTLTATDLAGNSTSCSFAVVVEDLIAPTITCPPNQTVNADNACQATLDDYSSGSFVNLTATVNSGSSGTICTDGFLGGAPEPQWDIKIAGQGYTTYPQSGICFNNAPNVQYNQSYLIGNYPTTVSVCFNAFEDDGAACLVAKSCSVEVCQNFITPAPGSSVTYTLNIPNNGINASWGTVSFTLQASAAIAVVSDNCPGVTVVQAPPPGAILNLGSNTVTLTASDLAGNTSSCSFAVTVVDNQVPTISCPATLTVDADNNACSYSGSIGTATATDNCPNVIVSGPVPLGPYPIGTTLVTWTATDGAGLTATCSQAVTVEDNQPPILTCPSTQVVAADNLCQAVLADYTVVSSVNLTVTVNSTSSGTSCTDGFFEGAPEPQRDIKIAGQGYTTYPQSGICFTSAPFLQYNQSYLLGNYPSTLAVCLNAFEDDGATCLVSKMCSVEVCQNFITPSPGSSVTYTLNIPNDGINTSWGTVTFTLQASAPIPALIATDNCAGVSVTQSPPAGSVLNLGSNTVTLTATDLAGNSTSCSFAVVVEDLIAPTITCPPNQTVNADNACQTTLDDYSSGSFVNLTATVNSGSSGTICTDGFLGGAPEPQWDIKIAGQGYTTYPQSGICFNNAPNVQYNQSYLIGNYPTTVSVCFNAFEDDGAACLVAKSCSVEVCQNFITPAPGSSVTYTLNIPNNGINASWGTVSFTLQASAAIAVVSDNCPGVTVVQAPPPGAILNLGSNTVTLTASDLAGNTSSCSFAVTVVDNQAPTISCPATLTVDADNDACSYSGSIGTATATDNCPNVIVSGPVPLGPYPIGTTLVTWTATDGAGLTATCSQAVTVEDNQPPILTCPSTQVVAADNLCQAVLADYTVVSSVNLTVTVNSTSSGTSCTDGFFEGAPEPQRDIKIAGQGYTTYPQNGICFTNAPFLQYNQNFTLGNYPTTLAVCLNAYEDDGAACVVAKSCSVEVCQNFITPSPGSSVTYTLNIPNDGINTSWGTVTFTLQASAPIPALIATDNCAGVSVTQSPPAGSVLNLGSNTVTLTATDLAGNSTSCSFAVVVEDLIAPTISCPPNQTVNADNACQATLDDYSSGSFVNLTATVNSGSSGTICTDGFLGGAPEPQWDVKIAGQGYTTYPQSGICFNSAPNLQFNQSYLIGNYPTTVSVCLNAFEDDGASCLVAKSCSAEVCQNFITPAPGSSVTYTLNIPNNGINASWGTVSFTLQASAAIAVVSDNCPGVTVVQAPPPGAILNLGSNTVTLTASDLAGNTSSCSFAVTVVDNQVPPTSIIGNTNICVGTSTTLTVVGGDMGVGGVAQWFTGSCGSVLVGTGPSIVVSPIINTTYFVRYLGACSTSGCISIAVAVSSGSPIPPIYANGPISFCEGNSVSISGNTGGGEWSTTETTPVITVVSSGTYFVTNANSCGGTTSNSIVVSVTPASLTPYSPAIASPYLYGFENAIAPQLFCGMSINNDNFPPDNEQWHTSTIAPHSGITHMAINANTDGTTAKDDWFFTAPVNLQAGKLYRLSFWYKGSNLTMNEQFEVYAGNTPYSFDMLSSAAIYSKSNIQNLNYVNDSTSNYIPTASGTYYFGIYANSLANQGSLYIDDLIVREVLSTQLFPGSCTTIPSMSDQLLVQPIYGAQDYEFKIENTSLGFLVEVKRNLAIPDFRLKWVPGILYDETYDVSVRYKKNNVWSSYGASCPVTLGPWPLIKLATGSCNIQLSDQNTRLITDSMPGATDYEYRIINVPQVYNHTWYRNSPITDFRLSWATSPTIPNLAYGNAYSVEVRGVIRVGNVVNSGDFGTPCTVTLLGQPQTQLVALAGPQQSCGKSLTNITDQIYCIPVSGVSNYRYKVYELGCGPNDTLIGLRNSVLNDYRLTWLPANPAGNRIAYGKTYQVRVDNLIGGVWGGYGAACAVITPASPLTQLQTVPYCAIYQLPTFTTPVYCNAVPGATNYRYRISSVPLGYNKTFTRNGPSNDFKFSWTLVCCGGQNLLPNQPYTVEVESYTGGVWSGYGAACTITSSLTIPRYSSFLAESGLTEAAESIRLSMYPNPATVGQEYTIELNGLQAANEKIQVDIYNMLGEKVYRSEMVTKEESNLIIKPESILSPGVYMIEARIAENVYREKMVVK